MKYPTWLLSHGLGWSIGGWVRASFKCVVVRPVGGGEPVEWIVTHARSKAQPGFVCLFVCLLRHSPSSCAPKIREAHSDPPASHLPVPVQMWLGCAH